MSDSPEPRELVTPHDLLSAHLDGELGPHHDDAVAEAIAGDPVLARRRDDLALVRAATRGLPPVDPPFGFFDRLVVDLQRPLHPRSHVLGIVGAAAAALVFAVAISPSSAPTVAPPVDELATRHEAVATEPISSVRAADDEYEPVPPAEVDGVPESYAGERPVAAFESGAARQVVYGEGDAATSLYVEPGQVDWATLDEREGRSVTVAGARAWQATLDAGGAASADRDPVPVLVVEQDGLVVVLVGRAAEDPSSVEALPEGDTSWSDGLTDACGGVIETFGFES